VTTLEDILQAAGVPKPLAVEILRRARQSSRKVLHICSHGEMFVCGKHRDPANQPAWLRAVPLTGVPLDPPDSSVGS
jgi:hypothetical protein